MKLAGTKKYSVGCFRKNKRECSSVTVKYRIEAIASISQFSIVYIMLHD